MTTVTTKIKVSKGELNIVMPNGMEIFSALTNKKALIKVIKESVAHQWLINDAASLKREKITGSNQIPSTATQSFAVKAFYISCKKVVEMLIEFENVSIDEAIAMGNALVKGNKIVANHDIIMDTIKEALRYGKQAGLI